MNWRLILTGTAVTALCFGAPAGTTFLAHAQSGAAQSDKSQQPGLPRSGDTTSPSGIDRNTIPHAGPSEKHSTPGSGGNMGSTGTSGTPSPVPPVPGHGAPMPGHGTPGSPGAGSPSMGGSTGGSGAGGAAGGGGR